MIRMNVRTNFPDVARAMRSLPEKVANQAMTRALNKTVEQARPEMARRISSEFVISTTAAKARLSITRASVRGGNLRVEAMLEATRKGKGRSMNVIAFMERKVTLAEARRRAKNGTLAQLRFKIHRRGGMKTINGAFVGNKGRTIFRRTGSARTPIEAVNTIDVPQMFNTRRLNEVVRKAMLSKFQEIFAREARYALSQWGGR
jgi:hypothetical protein